MTPAGNPSTAAAQARRTRRLAVVDPIGNLGGETRFVRALLPALQRVRPGLQTTFFGHPDRIRRDGIGGEFSKAGISVRELPAPVVPPKPPSLGFRAWSKVKRQLLGVEPPQPDVAPDLGLQTTQAIEGSDVAYFPWPYWIAVPALPCAAVTTIHDLNFKYFFGTAIFGLEDALVFDDRIGDWLTVAHAVASSHFMADEIARFYPSARSAHIIRLAPFAIPDTGDASEAAETVERLGVSPPYILCATHLTVHKNVGPLIAAQAILRTRHPLLRLVLTGSGTEAASGRATAVGTVRGDPDPDVIGLGYVSNQEIDSLIRCAAVVANPSLYEAGNGPGLDAWSRGTPVAMSNIPPFIEHLSTVGVEAALFDPRDPDDIAAKIADVLERPDEWGEAARRSRAAVEAYTWEDVARAYLDVFDAAYTDSPGA